MRAPPKPTPPPALASEVLAVLVRLSKEPLLRHKVRPAVGNRLAREGLIEVVQVRITERGTSQRREHWSITEKARRTLIVSNAHVAADAIDVLARQATAEARGHAARTLRRLRTSPPLRYPIPAGIPPPDLAGLVAVVVAGVLDSARAVTFAAELRAWADAVEAP